MMANVEQLATCLPTLPKRTHFIRHVACGLLAIFASFVILQMQEQPQKETPKNSHPSSHDNVAHSALMSCILLRCVNLTLKTLATLLATLWTSILRIVGTTLGVGLGLGLAGHIYDSLDNMQHNQQKNKNYDSERLRSVNSNVTPRVPATPFASSVEDPNSYHSLMKSAGYMVDNSTLRAQMVRGERATIAMHANGSRSKHPMGLNSMDQQQPPSLYKFDKGETAYARMKSMWPNLSPLINEALAKLTELVLRDYVACWYGKIDENVVFVDPASTLKDDQVNINASTSSKSTFMSQVKERRMTLANPLEVNSLAKSSSSGGESSSSLSHSYLSKSLPIGSVGGDTGVTALSSLSTSNKTQSLDDPSMQDESHSKQHPQNRTMVLNTTGTLPSPFLDSLYTSFSYLLGTLATRASENVNVLELLLLHLPHVLGENLRVYRELRGLALEKKRRRQGNASGITRPASRKERRGFDDKGLHRPSANTAPIDETLSPSSSTTDQCYDSRAMEDGVTEIAIIREYLLAGRLHRALTFGLDVPSLLFADPLAKDCPPSSSYQGINEGLSQNGHLEEDLVLDDRLLSVQSTLISDCELDYCRVLSSKIARLVVPKNEVESSIVRTMLVESLSSCVLMPVMGCFVPDSVNGWIITGLKLALEGGGAECSTTETGAATSSSITRSESDASLDGTNRSMFSFSRDNQHDEHSHIDCETDAYEILEKVLGDSDVTIGDGSVTSEMEGHLFEDIDDTSKPGDPSKQVAICTKAEQLITLLSMSIIELRNFVDFDDCRHAKKHNQDIPVDWDKRGCREAVRHLVLIIEAALLLGARSDRKRPTVAYDATHDLSEMVEATLECEDTMDGDEFEVDIDVVSGSASGLHQHPSISAVLMELTGDIDAFEKLATTVEQQAESADDDSTEEVDSIFTPKTHELSTLRTLIAAWLHTGQAFRVLSIIGKSQEVILRPFYFKTAFLRSGKYLGEFTRQLRQLEGVEILVDTTALLASQCLLTAGGGLENFERKLMKVDGESTPTMPMADEKGDSDYAGTILASGIFKQVGSVRANFVQNRDRLARFAQSATESFHFGQKLDVDEQQPAWTKPTSHNSYTYSQSSQSTPAYLQYNKNAVFASSLRAERGRRKESWQKETSNREKLDLVCKSRGATEKDNLMHRELHHLARFFYSNTNEIMIEPCSIGDSKSAANVTVKAIAPRRKIEVPDEDSSFLLRAQPRPLKPAAIHRDQNVANLACKIYVAMYEEPAIHPKTKYYPNDKTASVTIARDLTVLDRREGQPDVKHILSTEFQKVRHSCMKSGSLLSGPLMEPNDFSAFPRAGKAIDFIYRISFFERPVVELGGKKFIIHDASVLLHHRSDASSLELSDASLTAAIILRGSSGLNVCHDRNSNTRSFCIKISDNGSPLVLLRTNIPGKEHNSKDEARPYRPSFIRAALLVKSARQEAQTQCLSYCIKSGSARSSSKIKSDEWLQPTLTLLQYANSRRQEEQSIMLRDLRFGMNHIDRAQLCRNGLLNPRYPTILRGLTTKIESAVEVKAPSNVDLLGTPTLILFKIRCTAITEFIGREDDLATGDEVGYKPRYFREEWTVFRSLRDFSVFHKHMKGQVSPSEHSAGTGARLVGAATAALTMVGGSQILAKKERGPLVPSLSKATQAGTLGLSSKKVIERRKKLLDEYLKYLAAPNNLLSRCPELLTFLGAYTSIFPNEGNDQLDDEFGREDASRSELDTDKLKAGIVQVKHGTEERMLEATPKKSNKCVASSTTSINGFDTMSDAPPPEPGNSLFEQNQSFTDKKQMNVTRRIALIRSQEVSLKDVRRSAFRLLRNLFDLDNASFFRSRIISVLKTMSVAFTNYQDFHLMLFRSHVKYINGEWISGWIFYLIDMFWPNGVFYTRGPDLTESEKLDLKVNSKKMLERVFPLQLRTVLGKHSDEGLDMLHEMLQNRLVLKSIAYMLMDLVWSEIFPELKEFATGATCLDKEV
ncbi:hypothetical protein HJC23_006741 [Cyclotella cryptica]|uniref:PX domain-containing protein n=1 Tax=Cyclotella cryptica TaxID=29204 RepID=A0ABD3PP25_9STRA